MTVLHRNMLQWAHWDKMFTWKQSQSIKQHRHRAEWGRVSLWDTTLSNYGDGANDCYQQMVDVVTESFSLPDSVYIWALLVQVQGHGCVDVEVQNRISPVGEKWHTQEDKRSQRYAFSHSFVLLTLLPPHPSMVYLLVPGTTGPLFWLSEVTMDAEFMALAAFSFLL